MKAENCIVHIDNVIDDSIIPVVAGVLQQRIASFLNKEKESNTYVIFAFYPETEIELKLLIELNSSLLAAHYHSFLVSCITNGSENTPYYLKVEWPQEVLDKVN